MSDAPVIAIDLGGTKIRAVVLDGAGEIVGEDVRPTEGQEGQSVVIGRMVDAARAAVDVSRVPFASLAAVGVTAPGTIDFERGIIYQAPNLKGWDAVPLAERLREQLNLPTILENDANAAAYGEWRYGAGRSTRHMLYLTVSTGIGGGLILNGQLYRGADGAAGELGHVTVDDSGPLHNCGMVGCIEMMASGTAIARMAHEAVAEGRSEALARAAAVSGELTAHEVDRAAEAGDAVAHEILARAAHYLGVGLAGYVNIFNPQAIVLGGGVTRIGPRFLNPAFELAKQRSFMLPSSTVRFEVAALEGRAEVLGVAALARESV
jgi:glucokinase